MPQITLDATDAAELAQTLTFIAGWLTSSQQQTLADSFAAFVGHPAYGTDTLRADRDDHGVAWPKSSSPSVSPRRKANRCRSAQRIAVL